MRGLFLFGLALSCVATFHSNPGLIQTTEAVVPISGYEQNTIFNGKLTKRNTVIVTCTERDPIGQLVVGLYNVNVSCVPPTYNYRFVEVGAVPQATKLHVDRACLVKDKRQADAAQAIAAATQAAEETSPVAVNPAARRLLGIEFVVFQGLKDFLGKGGGNDDFTYNGYSQTALFNQLYYKYAEYDHWIAGLKNISLTNNQTIFNLQNSLKIDNDRILLLQNRDQDQQDLNANITKQFSNMTATIKEFVSMTAVEFEKIKAANGATEMKINSQFETTLNASNQRFLDVYASLGQITNLLQTEIEQLQTAQLNTAGDLLETITLLDVTIRRSQIHRLTTQAFFQSLETVGSAFKPFTLGRGIPPAGSLFGADKRVLMDRMDYNWRTNVTAGRIRIFQSTVRVYVNTVWGVDNLRYSTSAEQLLTLFGDNTCARSYADPDTPLDTPGTECKIWVEVRQSVCFGASANFEWAQQTTLSLLPSFCDGTITTLPVQILKTVSQVSAYFAQDVCVTPGVNTLITSYRLQTGLLLPRNSNCQLPWKTQLFLGNKEPSLSSVLYVLFISITKAFDLISLELFDRELKLFGRNPGGITYVSKDNDYVPSHYNGTTPIYDGGSDPVDCTYSTWLEVSKPTVPMYSVRPLTSPVVRKSVLVAVDGPVCTDPTVCYPVGEQDVTSNIDLNNDAAATLPGDFLMLGQLKDLRQGIWDVPSRSLSASSSTSERANTPSYILMKPGTTETFELNDWIGQNTDLFDAQSASVSPSLYRYDTMYDAENYPYCDLENNVITQTVNMTSNGCLRPYEFTNSSKYTIQRPVECAAADVQPVYANYQSELKTRTLNRNANSQIATRVSQGVNCLLSFVYKQEAVIGDGGAATVFGVFSSDINQFVVMGININGKFFVRHGNQIYQTAVDLRNGYFRFIAVACTYNAGNFDYTVYVDRTVHARFSVTGPQFNNLGPYVQYLDLMSPQSQSAQVYNVRVQLLTTAPTGADFGLAEQCALSNLPIDRCAAPDQKLVLAREIVQRGTNAVCLSGSILLKSDWKFDLLRPLPAVDLIQLTSTTLTLSFWVQGHDRSSPNVELLKLHVGSAELSILYLGGSSISVAINGASAVVEAYDDLSHFIGVVIDQNTAQVYLDDAFASAFVIPASSSTGSQFVSNVDSVFQVKVFAGRALSATEMLSEALCSVQAVETASALSAPIGYCTINSAATQGYGYCRHLSLCAGHCSVYAFVDAAAGTFSAIEDVCDAGYGRPSCLTKCSRVDPITGACLDVALAKAVGLTPGSTLCTTLNNYKMSVNPSRGTFTLTPRVWQYTVSLGVPNGLIANVINSGDCPIVEIFPTVDGSYNVLLENVNTQPSRVNVIYAPVAVFTAGAPCESPCCNLALDNPITISGRSSFTLNIPSSGCGDISIAIQQSINQFDPFTNSSSANVGECSRFTAEQLQTLVSTAFTQPLPTNVESRLLLASDQTSTGIVNVVRALGQQFVDLLALGTIIGFNNATFVDALASQRAALTNSRYNPFNLTAGIPAFDISSILNQLSASDEALQAAYRNSRDKFQNDEERLYALNQAAVDSLNQTDFLIRKSSEQLASLINWVNGFQGIGEPVGGNSDNPFNKFLRGIGGAVTDAALAASHAGRSFIDDALDLVGIPGELLGGLGSLIGQFVKVALAGVVLIGGGYLIFKVGSFAASGVSSSSAAKYQKFEPVVSSSLPISNKAVASDFRVSKAMYRASRYDPEFDYDD